MREKKESVSRKIIEFINNVPGLKNGIEKLKELIPTKDFYLVGGTIRDILLNKNPFDFDFAVVGSGIKLAKAFANKTKGKFILLSEKDDEARVFAYQSLFDFKGFGNETIEQDLSKRDFTFNAIAFKLNKSLSVSKPSNVIDPFKGLTHLRQKRICLVSPQSLLLDPLRILRAIRFACELKFKIDPQVWQKAKEISLANVAGERISYELFRILETSNTTYYLKKLYALNLLSQIFSPLEYFFKDKEIFYHSIRAYKKLEALIESGKFFIQFKNEWDEYFSLPHTKQLLKLAALFHDVAKPLTRRDTETGAVHFYGHDCLGAKLVKKMAKEHLRFSRADTERLARLIFYHMRLHLLATAPLFTDRAIRRFFRDLGNETFGLMMLTYADGYATAGQTKHLEIAVKRMIELKRKEEAEKQKERILTGYDLIALGLKPGPIFKKILAEIEDLRLEGKINDKESALFYIKEKILPTLL